METRINPPTGNSKSRFHRSNWIYLTIILVLLGSNVYLLIERKSDHQTNKVLTAQLTQNEAERNGLRDDYNAALLRLDQLTSENLQNSDQFKNSLQQIDSLKKRIARLLSKNKATMEELEEAKSLIGKLNNKISNYQQEVAGLTQKNEHLTHTVDSITDENKDLKQKVSIAKMLHVSNIQLRAVNLRKKGQKEETTTKAKRADLLRIVFELDQNDLADKGAKTFLIRIIGPDGTLLSNPALGSGSFMDALGNPQFYTLSQRVDFVSGISLKNLTADWQQTASYQKGDYIVEIYYSGNLVGQATTELK